jgi:hypothetical protein
MIITNFILPPIAYIPALFTFANVASFNTDSCFQVKPYLCADYNFGGYCAVLSFCEAYCYDLVDYGMLASFGYGVSSLDLPDIECKLWSDRECTGDMDGVTGTVAELGGFNDRTIGLQCWNIPESPPK